MDYFSEDHSKLLLSTEWLVKIDSEKSIPYMLKIYSSTVDLCCYILITDTKNVWAEVLQSNQLARRWRDCNPLQAPSFASEEEEDEWRTAIVELLSSAHSIGGIADLTFEMVKTHYSDLAFELGSDSFKWRWETCAIGPKQSAEVLSKHLIMPLISFTHLAFSSADPVSELSEADLEKAVDKVGRTARRTVDTHVKHAISRPRAATTLRRMTAMFNFSPDLPSISSEAPKPDLRLPSIRPKSRAASKAPQRLLSPVRASTPIITSRAISPPPKAPPPNPLTRAPQAVDGSETESESGEAPNAPAPSASRMAEEDHTRKVQRSSTNPANSKPSTRAASPRASRQHTPERRGGPAAAANQSTDDSSPPHPPPSKKAKRVDSSDENDSETERRRRVAQIKLPQRGARQPMKRGPRRF
ncbi:uncharacterized protein C8Q71DRAFT_528370 [Rhodofomes roseus]|uniref:XLF-like N-terminal domain-containing protein n=1 Tax=Rhodofomes roseus TaxID=34475 RepID=A0ABQ8KKB4_9APHY|nr:uncharacterized protein C8Q71DRAFT_528370 [Rhodofomes roseus]KAH9838409.1 hypothetical protein C8Q71DRAFT_528370 [Rhodofomes roseus]